MTPYAIVILICSMSISDRSECQPDTAVSVIQGPKVEDAATCALFGQSQLSSTEVAAHPDEYMKVVCKRG